MVLLRLIEMILGILAGITILTQIVFPLVFGVKIFPMFRTSRNKIEDEIREVQEQLSEKELKAHLEELRAKLQTPINSTKTEDK